MNTDIYKMKLHDNISISLNDTDINEDREDMVFVTKVPGGWIYRFIERDRETTVFVPKDF